jgi:hypothetical protein
MLLGVERQSLVGAAVKVDCELSHPKHRLVTIDKPVRAPTTRKGVAGPLAASLLQAMSEPPRIM